MTEPSAKRKRTDDEKATEVVRSDVWLHDGSIVLQAENTQFKIYEGLLARHSQIFADMIAVVHPQNDEHTVEGCNVVVLSDSAQDVRFMLLWLLDPRPYTSKPTVSNILSALRMGHKYMVVPLWDDAVERLQAEFPSTLEAFHARNAEVWSAILPEDKQNDILRLSEAVRDARLNTLLPMVYYRVLQACSLTIISNGGAERNAETPTCISLESRVMLLAARARVIEDYRMSQNRFTLYGSDECDQEEECAEVRNSCKLMIWSRLTGFGVATSDPALNILSKWSKEEQTKLRLRGLCVRCIQEMEETYEGNQEITWQKLPSYFGLCAWEELNDYSLK
ncbi:hypothetical protein GGF50DRAFT_114845 [Schizophyllum commune]